MIKEDYDVLLLNFSSRLINHESHNTQSWSDNEPSTVFSVGTALKYELEKWKT